MSSDQWSAHSIIIFYILFTEQQTHCLVNASTDRDLILKNKILPQHLRNTLHGSTWSVFSEHAGQISIKKVIRRALSQAPPKVLELDRKMNIIF